MEGMNTTGRKLMASKLHEVGYKFKIIPFTERLLLEMLFVKTF